MNISTSKTKAMYVRVQEEISPTTPVEASSVCKFTCPHPGCGHRFLDKHGMMVYAGKCDWRNKFVIENIIECRGEDPCRHYKVRWKGPGVDTWEPKSNLHPDTIIEFEKNNWLFDYD